MQLIVQYDVDVCNEWQRKSTPLVDLARIHMTGGHVIPHFLISCVLVATFVTREEGDVKMTSSAGAQAPLQERVLIGKPGNKAHKQKLEG